MKIKKLNLTNFRSHADTTIDNLPRFVVIRGHNHSGKTSLVHGIELALAARAETTDDRGAGAKDLIRTGADSGKALIKLRLQNDPTVDEYLDVRCALTQASGRDIVISNPADKTAKGDGFAHWLTQNRDILSCLINGRYFVGLKPTDQKALLAGIVLPETYEWSADLVAQVQSAGLVINQAARPFETIATVYKQAFDERRDINRDIKNFTVPEGDITAAGDVSEVRAKVLEYEAEHARLLDEQKTVDLAIQNHLTTAQNRRDAQAIAQSRLSTEQQQVEVFKKKVLSKAVLKTTQDLASKKDRALHLDTEITKAQTELGLTKEGIKKVQELDKNPNCPRCRQPVSEEVVALIAKPLIDRQNELGDNIRDLQDERKAIGDYEGAQRTIDTHEQAKVDLSRSEARVVEAHNELAGINAQIEGLGPVPVASEELAEAIADVKASLQQANERIAPILSANALKESIAKARVKQKALNERQQKLEKLVKVFGPGEEGIQAKLLAEYVGGFQDSMNKVLANWGYACDLSFDPYVFGIRRGNVTLPLNILSESEKHQFAIAFQVALAIHSGLLFAVVDASEIYDTAGRKQMFGALLNAGLDQVIVLGTDERTEVPDNQEAKGLAYYRFAAEKIDDVVTTTATRLLPAA